MSHRPEETAIAIERLVLPHRGGRFQACEGLFISPGAVVRRPRDLAKVPIILGARCHHPIAQARESSEGGDGIGRQDAGAGTTLGGREIRVLSIPIEHPRAGVAVSVDVAKV